MSKPVSIDDILEFWFENAPTTAQAMGRRNRVWFAADRSFDRKVAERFGTTLEAAARGELSAWIDSARGRLALILVLDQFPRNIHRGTPLAFGHDSDALALAREGIAMGHDKMLAPIERAFFYKPLQHAEDREAQALSCERCEALVDEVPDEQKGYFEQTAQYARQHRDIIERFDRFPHRNGLLGRASTPAEESYLSDDAPTFGQG